LRRQHHFSEGNSHMNPLVRKAVIKGARLVALLPTAGGLAGSTGISHVSHRADDAVTAPAVDDKGVDAITTTAPPTTTAADDNGVDPAAQTAADDNGVDPAAQTAADDNGGATTTTDDPVNHV
jgi:hypothetical protein